MTATDFGSDPKQQPHDWLRADYGTDSLGKPAEFWMCVRCGWVVEWYSPPPVHLTMWTGLSEQLGCDAMLVFLVMER